MLPIKSVENYSFDPLTSFIATLDNLQYGEIAMLQMIIKGVIAPFSYGMNLAVSDGQGGSFFADVPDLPNQCKEKTSYPLFASVIRIVAQGNSDQQTSNLAQELIRNISTISTNQNNSLIPLSNKGYEYENGHLKNVYYRQSNRFGSILSSKEISTFFHFPNTNVVSHKLHPQTGNTKAVKREYTSNKYVLGFNEHNGITETVSISENTFSRHLLLAGSTGSGKTHALKQLIQQSIQEQNVATVVIDGHGDLAQDLLLNIREQDKENIVFVNIADEEFSFGFNIFSAETEATKNLLSSDLLKIFQSTFQSTGDRINSVLQKTISTFLYSEKEASVLDMKRFLLETDFRETFLETLGDPILQYYWLNDFPLVKRDELSPLLLRIDSYLQTRLLRNFFALRKGIDFGELIEQRKTIIIQLSVGLIGLENSKFIANLIITKISQIAFSRALLSQSERHSIKLFIDESHYYANSENIEHILSGARKYFLNLCLVGQHLEQFDNHILNSILTNTATQIYFRQNDKDTRRIASSFAHFETDDFM
ncbi:helicase HerA-like domain-containing protein [uncultured Polaribacter sp.]|uniref:type IV secretory system conjugative DNA transfer family protein n=1 Tax=uncultured Polaribacter sp. TaxID=174711 RepID=UPI00259B5D67|nr:helicase HerA-like domain-containing protein [uncultured Polaribacter sp.]